MFYNLVLETRSTYAPSQVEGCSRSSDGQEAGTKANGLGEVHCLGILVDEDLNGVEREFTVVLFANKLSMYVIYE